MKVLIKNNEWSIKLVDGFEKSSDPLGLCDCLAKRISFNYNMCHSNVRPTILHELVHAFEWEYALSQAAHTHETIADFVGTYADNIVHVANQIEKYYRRELFRITK